MFPLRCRGKVLASPMKQLVSPTTVLSFSLYVGRWAVIEAGHVFLHSSSLLFPRFLSLVSLLLSFVDSRFRVTDSIPVNRSLLFKRSPFCCYHFDHPLSHLYQCSSLGFIEFTVYKINCLSQRTRLPFSFFRFLSFSSMIYVCVPFPPEQTGDSESDLVRPR